MRDHVISMILVTLTTSIAAIYFESLRHWFVLPVMFCGFLTGADAVGWVRGKLDTFDPRGIIGIFGTHFFFLSPIIFIAVNLRPVYGQVPRDWPFWIGLMGSINAVSLLFYKGFEFVGQSGVSKIKRTWVPVRGRTEAILAAGIAAAIFAQLLVFYKFRGFGGIAEAQFGGDATVFTGIGIPRILGNAAPLLCFFGIILFYRERVRRNKSLFFTLAVVTVLSVVQFAISGLYSSRGPVVTAMVWILILTHYFWRPIGVKTIAALFIPLFLLNWVYTFYKDLGPEVVEYLQRGATLSDLEKKTGRSFAGVLIGDLSRVDVQAYMLYRLYTHPDAYKLKMGATYLADITPIIPYWVWPAKPANSGKVLAGTELLWGKNFYKAHISYRRSNRAYGLAGEMMLNFGPYGVPVVYSLWGFIVGRVRRLQRNLDPKDLRWLIMPYIVWLLPNMLAWDFDNYLAHTLIRAAIPIAVVYLMIGKLLNVCKSSTNLDKPRTSAIGLYPSSPTSY